jgi:hypothetical protein
MAIEIKIEIEQQKDGSLLVKYKGMPIGELGDIKPLVEINKLHDLIHLRSKIMYSSKLLNDLNEEIEYRLARLLAFYHTEQ